MLSLTFNASILSKIAGASGRIRFSIRDLESVWDAAEAAEFFEFFSEEFLQTIPSTQIQRAEQVVDPNA